jgi:DNA (cytosine-5)-methyltransferase 1
LFWNTQVLAWLDEWTLKDANFTKDKGKVFSCFACGGGSTMGYKLAGFDVLGCN